MASLSHAAGRASQRAPISRAARATLSTAPTPKIPPSTSSCSTGSRASSPPPNAWCRRPVYRHRMRTSTSPSSPRQLRRRGARGARYPGARSGIKTNYMRLRAFPFGDEVEKFLDSHTSWCSSSSRTATRRCARCSRWKRRGESQAALAAALQRLADFLASSSSKACSPKLEPKSHRLEAVPRDQEELA